MWNKCIESLPEHNPNTDGKTCVVVCEKGNVYRAKYMHDVYDGGEEKYWSEFTIAFNGCEVENYQITEKIVLWAYLPEVKK